MAWLDELLFQAYLCLTCRLSLGEGLKGVKGAFDR